MAERLKILYISHYFPPEVNAPAVRVSELAKHWSESGHDVTVLTGFPNHPTGVVPIEYKGVLKAKEKHGRIRVIRTYLYAAANKGFVKRILNYLSFMLSAIVLGTPSVGKPDIIVATSPQFFVAVAGYFISRIKRCKFIFEVRDLWPEEIVAVGAIKNSFVINMLEAIEMFLYRKADMVVAVAQGTIDTLVKRGISAEKLALIPNGVDISHFQNTNGSSSVRKKLKIDDKFVVSYVGTHGLAHRLDTVLDAASKLKNNNRIQFLFVGDGAEKKRLVERSIREKLDNVLFHDQIDRTRISDFYAATDLFLVPLRKADLFTRNIPSKIYEIMAARKPMLIATNGESRRLVESAGAGIGITPEDSDALVANIKRLLNDEKLRHQMGQSGYAFALANASRKRLADDYLWLLYAVVFGNEIVPDTHLADSQDNSSNVRELSRTKELV